MNKTTITIHLTNEAQRAAIIAGEPGAAKQSYDVPQELVARVLALPWANVQESGDVTCVVPDSCPWTKADLDKPLGTPWEYSRFGGSHGRTDVAADKRPADAAAAIAYAEGVVPRVTADLDKSREERARELAEREQRARANVELWLSFPPTERATARGIATCEHEGHLGHIGSRIVEENDIKRFAPEAYAETMGEVKRLQAERKAAEAAEKQREADAKAACELALREIAAGTDDLARAAKEGYRVATRTLDRLVDLLLERTPVDYTHRTSKRPWNVDASDERSAPSRDAFQMLDAISIAAREENEKLPAAIGKWEVSRILRLDVCPHDGHRHHVTAVLATLETPLGDREVLFSTEPLECNHDDVYDD